MDLISTEYRPRKRGTETVRTEDEDDEDTGRINDFQPDKEVGVGWGGFSQSETRSEDHILSNVLFGLGMDVLRI